MSRAATLDSSSEITKQTHRAPAEANTTRPDLAPHRAALVEAMLHPDPAVADVAAAQARRAVTEPYDEYALADDAAGISPRRVAVPVTAAVKGPPMADADRDWEQLIALQVSRRSWSSPRASVAAGRTDDVSSRNRCK